MSIAFWFKNKLQLIQWGLILSTILIAVPLFVPINLNRFTTNEFHLSLSQFSSQYILTPHPKTRYTQATYTTTSLPTFELYTPKNVDFFWATGDGPLPCVQQQQIDYFRYYYKIEPELRGTDFKDGFFSKVLEDE